jgi:predicted nucleotidyltransferase
MDSIKASIRMIPSLRWLLLVSNWISQGMIHADRTEKLFKLSITVVFTLIFFLVFEIVLGRGVYLNLILSFMLAHTLNWILTSNLFVIFMHRLARGKSSRSHMFTFLEQQSQRLQSEPSILCAAAFGSMSRGELKDTSDLDVTFVRRKGFRNGLSSFVFLVRERKRAHREAIPLESFLGDSIDYFRRRYREDEAPVILHDPDSLMGGYYQELLSLDRAKVINNI